jgi:hypothetical protein
LRFVIATGVLHTPANVREVEYKHSPNGVPVDRNAYTKYAVPFGATSPTIRSDAVAVCPAGSGTVPQKYSAAGPQLPVPVPTLYTNRKRLLLQKVTSKVPDLLRLA